ncbi:MULTISPECIES: acyl-homoserine-lactone synthase TraI [Rhizobium]|uniref:Acyl-homoserine-lactone synthase n=1 Tax=Rhizobium esperanzae TaxID=1967781 RepID=A0A2D0AAE3_9HYPH|nr:MULTISPECIES: acyl-homoserine-lactone synthase TraI [Rhizobium]OWO91541.1 autoinducer synthesis protein [Rhizobium esperanzae]PCK83805.1 autoinducer synthesis protein [Rhizobium sophoriradicis]PDS72832.1 autoinducer synthesis protein [Rhizobium sp. L43]ULJ82488.1 autoinducer synthesis protein [Rhizobium sp. C104]
MQVFAISTPKNCYEAQLVQDHHRLRASVFSTRLNWDVEVVDDCEADGFDALGPTYILAVTAAGRLAGCARLLPAMGPTMLADVFPSLLPKGRLNAHPLMVESSRFCVDTALEEGRGDGSVHEATRTMFAGIVEWCLAGGLTEVVTVTDIRFERILARVEWPLQRLGQPEKIGATTAIAGTLPANAETFLRLRPPNYQSNLTACSHQA